jgi:galactokinase
MYETHEGLSKEYEVSCPELDFLVEQTFNMNGAVIGARMMGGGFGGCTINLVRKNAVDDFIDKMTIAYKNKFNRVLLSYKINITNGVEEIKHVMDLA